MPARTGIRLPANLVQELGLPNESTGSRRLPSSDRKAARKAARVEKRQKPLSSDRKILRQLAHAKVSAKGSGRHAAEAVPSLPPNKQPQRDTEADAKVKNHRTQLRSLKISESEAAESQKPKLSRKLREKLAEDDAEIEALERRLGLKGRKGLPKSFDDDGLGDLLGDLETSNNTDGQKESRLSLEEEDWLHAKRRKALQGERRGVMPSSKDTIAHEDDDDDESEGGDLDMDLDMLTEDSESDAGLESLSDSEASLDESDNTSSSESFQDLDDFDEEETKRKPTRLRENPYIAPQPSSGTKYIPPSLRKPSAENSEEHERLRRQIKGTLNRLSEAKVLAITAEMEKIYRENARQHVSSILLDTLFQLICDPAPLQDTFMILHAGFVAALYKTIGTEFGAQVVQRWVDEYDQVSNGAASEAGKRLSNMITFLAELYNFQVVGSPIIYDMIRNLTTNLDEENAELLLRIARNSGNQLRQDDSASLKDIVTLLHAAVEKYGTENLSVRAKFMIETIENLKNNKTKTGVVASSVRTQHTTAMKKTLGSMNSTSIRTREPLRIGLADIRNADRRGKWWLVGASFNDEKRSKTKSHEQLKKQSTTKSTESTEIDLNELAREQGMNTDIRRAIFISLVSSSDDKEACVRLQKLGMKSKQKFEIPKIIVHCVGAEKKHYNAFYTKIARKLCAERDIQKAFQFTLWEIFRRFEDHEDDGEDRLQGELDMTAIVFIAKMYGELVAGGLQSILLLKHMELAHPDAKSKTFAEVFLITIFQQFGIRSKNIESKVKDLFETVAQEPEMIAGLQLFLKKSVRPTKLVQDGKEKDLIRTCCKVAGGVLIGLMSKS